MNKYEPYARDKASGTEMLTTGAKLDPCREVAMTEQEAHQLAAQIAAEPGWHARAYPHVWVPGWQVCAWQGAGEDAETEVKGDEKVDSYLFSTRGQWYALRRGARENADADRRRVGWVRN